MLIRATSTCAALAIVVTAISATPAQAVVTDGRLAASSLSLAPATPFTLSGQLSSKVRRPIVLKRKTAGAWSKVTTSRTTKRGMFRFSVIAPTSAGKHAYRVFAAKRVVGARTYMAVKTPTTTVAVVVKQTAPVTPAPTTPALGSRENPYALDTPFRSGSWQFSLAAADFDAWPEIQAENQFNDPPAAGWSYVTVPVTYTYFGSGSKEPFWSTDVEFVGSDGIVYDEGVSSQYCGVVANQTSDLGEMFAGAVATGVECVPVPTTAISGGQWRVTDSDVYPSSFAYVRAG